MIPITITSSFWILATLIAWLSSGGSVIAFMSWIIIVLISVLVHELGHALTAKFWGQNTEIILGSLGGTTIYGTGKKPLSRLQEFIVVLAGPIFGFLLAFVAGFLSVYSLAHPNLFYFLHYTMFANIVWSLFNLLPVHPFDGGKLMSILFEGIFGSKGLRFSYLLSGIIAVVLIGLAMAYGQIFAAVLLVLCAFESFRNFRERRFFKTTAKEKELDELEPIELEWANSQPDLAIEHLEAYVKKTNDVSATLRLAEMYAATGKTQKAYNLLHTQKVLDIDALKLLQLVSYKLGLWKEALDAGNQIFRESQDPSCAIMNAFCAAHQGDVKAAVNWLATVKKTKAVDMNAVLAASDFDSIRSDPLFKEII